MPQYDLNIQPASFEDTEAVVAAYQSGECDAFTDDRSWFAALGSAFQNHDITVTLPATTDCDAEGAICTEDGRMLSNELVLTVGGP